MIFQPVTIGLMMVCLVRFDGMEEVEPYEFKTLQRAKVYVNGENLMFDYEKGHQQ